MKRFIISIVATLAFSTAVHAQEVEPRVITVSARQFAFTPNEITLRRGEPITLRVTSTERIRHFYSKELRFNVDLRPNQPHDITLVPVKAGRFVASSDSGFGDKIVIDVE
ncbi:MAG TPA: cupredoxin domain-containing protein [Thermoanaerobaculia bacterium]|nr:cupredoxin domain-containing protein [Thermoanaerobaculia bacterium]